jgi:hypothetical protein
VHAMQWFNAKGAWISIHNPMHTTLPPSLFEKRGSNHSLFLTLCCTAQCLQGLKPLVAKCPLFTAYRDVYAMAFAC